MSADDALDRLGESTAEACLGVLEMFAAGKVSTGEVTTLDGPQGRRSPACPCRAWPCRCPTSTASPAATSS